MSDSDLASMPLQVPARMVNEFAYCPRLFFLEWVQGRFEANPDTALGSYEHRAVDVERGIAPAPTESHSLREARSVLVGSERLGLIGRIDVLEPDADGRVRPMDVKKGRPPDNPERAWEPERVQLCVAGLLLRENGYRCEEGVLYFAETKERVTVPFTEALIVRTLELLLDLHRVAQSDVPPPPLVDSPKCPRCSLVGICLPDETNLLAGRSEEEPRRLVPRDHAARPLYVSEQGTTVGTRGGRLTVRRKDAITDELRWLDVSQVNVFGQVQVTTGALRECFRRQVPVCWFTHGGWFQGMAHGLPSKHVELRRRQVVVASQGGLEIARRVVAAKIRNCRVLLRRNSRATPIDVVGSLKLLAEQALTAPSVASLLGIEGSAARLYFGALPSMLRDGLGLPGAAFSFEGRNRRPPLDPVNCLLSYLYAILAKDLTVVTNAIGFDPFLGFYHRPRFGRPALALDLAEEFRPLVADSTMLMLINNGEVAPSDFVVRARGVGLTPAGRKKVITAYERRLDVPVTHPVFGYRVTYRRVFEVQARLLAAHLLGEVPEYSPFMTR